MTHVLGFDAVAARGLILSAIFAVSILPIWFIALKCARSNLRSAGVVILTYFLALEYAVRIFQTLSVGQYGWNASSLAALPSVDLVVRSICLTWLGLAGIWIGFALAPVAGREFYESKIPRPDTPETAVTKGRWLVLGSVTLIVLVAYSSSGLRMIGSGSFGRSNFGSGASYALGQVFVPVVLVLLALRRLHMIVLPRAALLAGTIAFSALHLLFIGGRVEIVTLALGALAISQRRNGWVYELRLTAALIAGTVVLAAYRIYSRERFYQAQAGDLGTPIDFLTRGDVSGYDKLLFLLASDHVGSLSGDTYLRALTGLVPGTLPSGTGSRVFTQLSDPGRFARDETFEGVSFLGEALLNFGWLGLAAAATFFGLFVGLLVRWRDSPISLFSYGLACGAIPTVLRADAANSLTTFLPMWIFGTALAMFMSARLKGTDPATAALTTYDHGVGTRHRVRTKGSTWQRDSSR